MSQNKMQKTFNCVEFKRKAQAEIYAEIEHLTPREQTEYFRRKAESSPLGSWWASVKRTGDADET